MPKPPRLPPPKLSPKQAQEPTPAPEAKPSEAEVRERLEAARRTLQTLVLEYKDLLQLTQLASNRSTEDNRNRQQLLFKVNDAAGKLEFENAGEGLMTLCISSMHAILILKDEINDLKFQNAILNKKIKNITDKTEK
jgi:hypothetical protein